MTQILLYCDDDYFVESFSNFASAHATDLEFYSYTNWHKAMETLNTAKKRWDAVLADPEFLDEISGEKFLKLAISEETRFGAEVERTTINIYQPGNAIITDILNALAVAGGKNGARAQNHARIIPVLSGQGGAGCSVVSYALAAAAVRSGKNAVYLNLEYVPTTQHLYQHTFTSDMDDLLFALKDGRDIAPTVMNTLERNRDGVLVLPGFHSLNDMMSLTQQNLQTLLSVLAEKASVDYIFVDFSAGFGVPCPWVLEESVAAIQVYTDTQAGWAKLSAAQQDPYIQELPLRGSLFTVINQCRKRTEKDGADAVIPFSESLQNGVLVSDVQNRNPAFLQACMELLNKLN